MSRVQRSTVSAVFDDYRQSDRAADELRRDGFGSGQIEVAAHDQKQGTTTGIGTNAVLGAACGAGEGGVAGAFVALAVVAGVVPGFGPAVAAGVLSVFLFNVAAGAAVGAAAGVVVGLRRTDNEAVRDSRESKVGRQVVTVNGCGDRCEEAGAVLRRNGGHARPTRQ